MVHGDVRGSSWRTNQRLARVLYSGCCTGIGNQHRRVTLRIRKRSGHTYGSNLQGPKGLCQGFEKNPNLNPKPYREPKPYARVISTPQHHTPHARVIKTLDYTPALGSP